MVNGINFSNNTSGFGSGIKKEDIQSNLSKSQQAVTDYSKNTSTMQALTGTADTDSTIKALTIIPPLMIIDNFVNHTMGGSENKSILKKIANVGDKISDKLHLDKVFNPTKKQKIAKSISNNRFTKYFTNKYQAVPRMSAVKATSLSSECADKLVAGLRTLVKNEDFIKELANDKIQLTNETKNVLNSIAKSSGQYKLPNNMLINAADDLIKNGIEQVKKDGLLSSGINLSQLNNKLKTAESKIGKSALGNGMAKGFIKGKNLITYGGGAFSLFFAAQGIVAASKAAKEAPKGEKLSTFMHVFSEGYLGLALLQPSANILYKAGGNKYRGMTQQGREALKNLINTTNANKELTKEGLKIAKMQKKLLIKGVDKDKVAKLAGKGLDEAKTLAKSLKKDGAKLKFWEKPLKFAGKVLSMGLDKLQKPTYIKGIKIPKPTVKGFVGGLGRFILITMAIQPFIQKPITKLFHKIFGKPKTYLEKQNQTQNADNNSKTTQKTDKTTINTNTSNSAKTNGETNLVNKHISDSKPQVQNIDMPANMPQNQNALPAQNINNNQTPIKPESKANNTIASSALNKNDSNNDNSDRYIPSIDPITIEDNTKEIDKQVNEIIKSTDSILNESKKYI